MNSDKIVTLKMTVSEFRAIQDVLYYTLENEQAHFIEAASEDVENPIEYEEARDEAQAYIYGTTTGHIYRDAYNADQAMLRNIPNYQEATKTN